MSTPEISQMNFVMTQFHLKYHYSKIWNEEEIKQWNAVAMDLQTALQNSEPKDYEEKIKEILKNKLAPLALSVGLRYVQENKIAKEGVENIKCILFEDPKRPVELAVLNDDVISISDVTKKDEENK